MSPTIGPKRRDRPLLVTFGAVLLLIGAASAVFVGSYNGQRVAGLATRVQQVERTLGSAELARVYIAQAAYLSSEPSTTRRETVSRTLDAASESLAATGAEIEQYFSLLKTPDVEISESLAAFSETAHLAINQLQAGQVAAVKALVVSRLGPTHEALQEALLAVQRNDAGEINQTSTALGRVADVVRFLLAFAIPAAGMTVYRWVMNRQRRQSELQLRIESEKAINKSKDEFIANVSHELRTPLTGIVGFAQLLCDSKLERDDLEIVKLIVNQSADLSRMVDDLLTAARADANALTINPRPVAIAGEVAEVIRFIELMQTDIEVKCQEAMVVIDPERFRQVLRNLLVNARKHGGSAIKVRGGIKDGTYVCTVIDDGPGVPEHVRERLFSRFVHTGEAPVIMGSVGLGLAIVRELCRLMGCEVAYRRVRGETWFSVTMPMADAALDLREALAASA
ncbi:hypothetical protein BH18ACT5_BH18ACT5_05240 [soil metagenome]